MSCICSQREESHIFVNGSHTPLVDESRGTLCRAGTDEVLNLRDTYRSCPTIVTWNGDRSGTGSRFAISQNPVRPGVGSFRFASVRCTICFGTAYPIIILFSFIYFYTFIVEGIKTELHFIDILILLKEKQTCKVQT